MLSFKPFQCHPFRPFPCHPFRPFQCHPFRPLQFRNTFLLSFKPFQKTAIHFCYKFLTGAQFQCNSFSKFQLLSTHLQCISFSKHQHSKLSPKIKQIIKKSQHINLLSSKHFQFINITNYHKKINELLKKIHDISLCFLPSLFLFNQLIKLSQKSQRICKKKHNIFFNSLPINSKIP